MTDCILTVVQAGPHVTIQDAGRPGFQRFGVPQSGPMDRLAMAAANRVLGNARDAAGIEVSLGGLEMDCIAGGVDFALAGGGFLWEHAGVRGGSWSLGRLEAGEKLRLKPGFWGVWGFLALGGDLVCDRWLGSAATHAPSGLGGGALRPGMRLTITGAGPRGRPAGRFACPPMARPRPDCRVTLGPQAGCFSRSAIAVFQAGPWAATAAFDRMGMRLRGPDIAPEGPLDMPSGPVVRGSVQVAGDGVATVLMADHQTTGGYPRIATVLDCDLDALAQLRPGDPLAFRVVNAAAAVAIARTADTATGRYLAGLARA